MLGSIFLLQFLSCRPVGAGRAQLGCFPTPAVTGKPLNPRTHI